MSKRHYIWRYYVSPESILQKYNQKGAEGVVNKKKYKKEWRGNEKALLNSLQIKKLSESLAQRPPDREVGTGPKVARWIEKETGIEKVWN